MPDTPPPAIICRNCGTEIGRELLVDGRSWLLIGCAQLDAAHGVCACGGEFWWTSGSRHLDRLLERVSSARRTDGENAAE